MEPRRRLPVAVLWRSLFTAFTGAVSAYPLLLAVRFLFGAVEAGAAFPNASVAISNWFPPATHGILWMKVDVTATIPSSGESN